MPIRARVPGPLAAHTGGKASLEIEAQSVGEALQVLEQRFPALVPLLRDAGGALRPKVNLYVNDEHVRFRQGLQTPLRDGDTLLVVPIVMGG
jgi:molybdopterin converting factor small subunit